MRQRMLRLWPDKPSKKQIDQNKKTIEKFETKKKFRDEVDKRLEEKNKRKPLFEGMTKKEKAALILKTRKK